MSVAAGEYVSVSSQADIERADIEREKQAIESNSDVEHAELVAIYQHRGLSHDPAKLVAKELTQHDALAAHVRDELGLSEIHAANPLQATFASGATFTVAGGIPLLAALLAREAYVIPVVLSVTVPTLALLGYLGARVGGAPFGASVRRKLIVRSLSRRYVSGSPGAAADFRQLPTLRS